MTGPGFSGSSSLITAVTGLPSGDVWSFGRSSDAIPIFALGDQYLYSPFGGYGPAPVVVHWDGKQWSRTWLPSDRVADLAAATALSQDDIWAIGNSHDRGSERRMYSVHWDGSTWSEVLAPEGIVGESQLEGIYADAPDDIWAVGHYTEGNERSGTDHPLLLRSDGAKWQLDNTLTLPCPAMKCDAQLVDVEALSRDDVWVIGNQVLNDLEVQPFAIHWDGAAWIKTTLPESAVDISVSAIDHVTPTDLWIVGDRGLALHWDGTTWRKVITPFTGREANQFYDVVAIGSDDVWAIGTNRHIGWQLFTHWDGNEWSEVPVPEGDHLFLDATVASPGQLWVVGETFSLESKPWFGVAMSFTRSACAGSP